MIHHSLLVMDTVARNTTFAISLYQELKNTEGNLFLSPYSISTALAITCAGARDNTAKQMAETLHFPLDQKQLHPAFAELKATLNAVQAKEKVELHVANSLWPQKGYPFLKEYLDLTKKYYGVTITPVDYKTAQEATRKMINTWVEGKTERKIKDIIQPGVLDALTRLVLVSAIYFKGNWESQFKRSATKHVPFHLSQKKSVSVPMMNQTETFGYTEHENVQILELPYVGSDLSRLVLLPKEIDGLADLEKALRVDNLENWRKRLRKRVVSVFLPRFKITSQFRLTETLKSMGMTDAFDASKANFSGMDGNLNLLGVRRNEPEQVRDSNVPSTQSPREPLYIGSVLHKAFVVVNEEGTEAAAATYGIEERLGLPLTFRANHPFLFLICDNNSGSVLFMGRVVNPTKRAGDRSGARRLSAILAWKRLWKCFLFMRSEGHGRREEPGKAAPKNSPA